MAGEDLEGRLQRLERRLARLEAAESIRNLKARYAELTDARYGPDGAKPQPELDALAHRIAELFTEDAVWDGGRALGSCRGRREIYQRLRAPTLRFSRHYFVKPEIEVQGDTARARWDVLAPCTSRDGEARWLAGVEHDEYARVAGVWLHRRMQLEVVFFAPHARGWARSPDS